MSEKKIDVPVWSECVEKQEYLDSSKITIAQSLSCGGELNPLEGLVFDYDDADIERSKEFRASLKLLVEWCLNNPDQVLSNHESIINRGVDR